VNNVTLRLGDCLEILPTLESGSVDAVITDPPYGIDYQSARRTDRAQWKPKIENDKEPFLDWLPEAYRVTRDGGAMVCFCRWDVEETFKKAIEQAGYSVKSQIIWDKRVHGMGDLNGSFAPQHENAWFAVKGNFRFWSYRPQDVIRVPRISAEDLVHPNEKPVPLFVRLIEPIVKPGGVVLDCFFGSGNSGKAAQSISRNYIGVDIDPKYYTIAQKRIAEAQQQMVMFA
jgi:DNA modification methylase